MALTEAYLAWRLETDLTSRRDKLIRHIQELEAEIAGWESQRSLDQAGARNLTALQEMLKRREADLATLETSLGLTPAAVGDVDPFVSMRPVDE